MQKVAEGLYAWGGLRGAAEYESLEFERAALRALVSRKASDRELRQCLNAFARGYITRRMRSLPITVFRASRPTNPEAPWDHLKELWTPPAHSVTWNRFNEPKKPVLYMSGDPFTALAEVRSQPNEVRVVLVLRKKTTQTAMHFAQLGIERLPQYGFFREAMRETSGGLQLEPVLQELLSELRIRAHWQKQDNFFADIATLFFEDAEAEKHYRLSFLAGKQLQSISGTDGFFYPSAATDYRGFNIATPTNTAKAHFRPLEAWLVPLGRDPRFYAWTPTDPREPVVIRRGTFNGTGNISWGDEGWWPMHALHREIAPLQDIDIPNS